MTKPACLKVGSECKWRPLLVPVTKCAAGKKLVPKNGANAAKCEACASGTFNAKDDASDSCAKHNTCEDSATKTKGTATQDAVCETGVWAYLYTRDLHAPFQPLRCLGCQ